MPKKAVVKGLSEKVVAGGFTLALLLLGGVGVESYLSVSRLVEDQQRVEHTHHVLDILNKIPKGMEDADRGRRGYFVLKSDDELNAWRAGVQETKQAIAEARQLTIDNPEQQRRLSAVEPLIAQRLALFQQFVGLVRQTKLKQPDRDATLKQNFFLQQKTQTVLQAMEQAERTLLQQRSDATVRTVQQAVAAAGIGYSLSFGLLAGVFFLLNQEIRSRKQAEIALQKHAEEVYDLYNHAPCGYYSLDADGIFIRINETELKWLGYTRDEVVHKKTFAELATAQSALVFEESFLRFKEQGWLSDEEFELVRKDGTLLPVSLSATAIRDAEGNFVMSRSTLFDISDRKRAQAALQQANEQLEAKVQARTAELSQVNALLRSELIERKQAEQALLESEKQLRLITDALPVLISYIDAEQRYRFNNRAYEQWFGCDWTEIQGQHLSQVLGESAYQSIEPYIERVLSGQDVTYESLIPYRDGGMRWVSAIYLPDFGERGEVRGYFALVADINDRKLAEQALLESEKQLRLITDALPVLVSYVDADQRYRFNNQTYEQWYGHTRTEITGQHLRQVIGESAYQRIQPYIEAALSGQGITYESMMPYQDGGTRWIDATYIPDFGEQGNVQGFFALIADVTDRKQAELALQQAKDGLETQVQERTAALKQSNDDLQRSNQELEQFAYVASHDLQEPLRAIMGYTQLLTQDYRDRLDETAQGYGGYIVEGARRMQQLIQDLLHYSRAGTRDLDFAPTDGNAVLEQVLSNLQVAIAESNASITYDPLPTVTVDQSQLVQLFQNLIGNAIKFCREKSPQIHISATKGEERETEGQQETEIKAPSLLTPHPSLLTSHTVWLFSVRDNGIGIKPRYLERIFEIFKRLHTRTEFSGTGIGLAICKKIVDRHGGHIWATSAIGNGTTFYFTIPYDDSSDL